MAVYVCPRCGRVYNSPVPLRHAPDCTGFQVKHPVATMKERKDG